MEIRLNLAVPDDQNRGQTIRDSETSGRVKRLLKKVFKKTEKRVITE